MKTIDLDKIIEKHRLDIDHYADQDFSESCIEKICLEFGEQLLELAAENAVIYIPDGAYMDNYVNPDRIEIDKYSITNTIKQIE